MKAVSIPTLEMYRDNMDAGMDFERQAHVQQHINAMIHSSKFSLDEHKRVKVAWDNVLMRGDFSAFQWKAIQFDGLLPVVSAGSFMPEYDFEGAKLQSLLGAMGTLALMGFNIIPINKKTYAIFGYLDGKEANQKFLDSLVKLSENALSSSIVQFCFETSDNTFVNPTWWNSLPSNVQKSFLHALRENIPGSHSPTGLIPLKESVFEMPGRVLASN